MKKTKETITAAKKVKTLTPGRISAFLDALAADGTEMHGLVILQHGKTLAEGWWKPYSPDIRHQLFSLSKSFTSTAAGFAVTEGLISLDDPVVSFFPEKSPKDANEHLKAMKIRHLLSMSTGHEKEPAINGEVRDWVKLFLATAPTKEPGTHFLYNSLATYMVSAIVQKVTGMTVRDYLMPRLFTPLGIPDPEWDCCPKGINAGGWGLWLNPREIARFGQFLLQKGVWEGKQLIPADWIDTASRSHIDNRPNQNPDWEQGYGFQFWRCRHGFYRGDGAFGQYCIVMEKDDMVVAINSGVQDMQAVMDKIWTHLSPSVTEEDSETGRAAAASAEKAAVSGVTEAMLAAQCAALERKAPALTVSPAEALTRFAGWKDKSWALNENLFGFTRLGFAAKGRTPLLIVEDSRGAHRVPFGWGAWSESDSTVKQHNHRKRRKFHCAASADWTAGNTLEITIRFSDTPDFYAFALTLKKNGTLEGTVRPSVSFFGSDALKLRGKP